MNPGALNFTNEAKIRMQMQWRGWTEQQLQEALREIPVSATGKNGPALRYIHPTSGKSVVVDQTSGEIFHVGDEGFLYE